MPAQAPDGKPKAGAASSAVKKWWIALSKLVWVQLVCSLLMQLSYVAFPGYNFALALWCLACCTPSWIAKHPKLVPFQIGGLSFSIITDVIWMGLWVSGRVFYDQFCGTNGVSIVSCGGATDYFPGCSTNQFALFMLIVNDIAKVATCVCLQRTYALTSRDGKKRAHHDHGSHGSEPGEHQHHAVRLAVGGDETLPQS